MDIWFGVVVGVVCCGFWIICLCFCLVAICWSWWVEDSFEVFFGFWLGNIILERVFCVFWVWVDVGIRLGLGLFGSG